MTKRNRMLLHPTAIAGAVAVGLAGQSLPALAAVQKDTRTADASRINETGWSSQQAETLALNLDQLLVARISRAAQFLNEGAIASARDAVVEAEHTAGAINGVLPQIRVVDSIRHARSKLLKEGVAGFKADLVHVNGQIDHYEMFAPEQAQRAKAKITTAEMKAEAKDVNGAALMLQQAADDIEADAHYLPVGHARAKLEAARLALSKNTPDVAGAKAALGSALDMMAMKANGVPSQSKS